MAKKVGRSASPATARSSVRSTKGRAGAERGKAIKSNKLNRDLGLVERFRNGDLEAFNTIFETYSGPLLGFLTRMCGDPEDAKEGLQDTFLAVFRYLTAFRGEASLKNWIFKIAVTMCLRKKRKADSLRESKQWKGETLSGMHDPAHPLISPSRLNEDPEALILDREFREYLVQGVASMPYIYKIVINLRDFEGFSTQEVSQMLGVKESTVKVRLHRARLYLREWLKRRYPV